MVPLPSQPSDDPRFIEVAERVINAEAALVSAGFLHIVRIDAWFGPKWYSFTGKLLGALAVHSPERLRVPPFHPHRVVSEERFQLTDPPVRVAFEKPFHTIRPSELNYYHAFGGFGRCGATVAAAWYSGDSASSGRGAIMVYSEAQYAAAGWYAGLERLETWDVVKLVGIDRRHWLTLVGGPPAAP